MMPVVGPDGQAILLLTAPLLVGGGGKRSRGGEVKQKPLNLPEYNALAAELQRRGLAPAVLLDERSAIPDIARSARLDPRRIDGLFGRGYALARALERWEKRGIWVLTRADNLYPQLLRKRMKRNRPPVLYGCGNPALLDRGGLAVVGSRAVADDVAVFAEEVGALCASSGVPIVSGGAKGVDQAAMRGTTDAGGCAVGILANNLARAVLVRANRDAIMQGCLALVSSYDPAARFFVGHAMARNRLIYGLADSALVINSDLRRGGTWTGAMEQLGKLNYVPVYVRNRGRTSEGLVGLMEHGAEPWPNPRTPDELRSVMARRPHDDHQQSGDRHPAVERAIDAQGNLFPGRRASEHVTAVRESVATPTDRLLIALKGEMSRDEISESLKLSKSHVQRAYLRPCLERGWVARTIPDKPGSINQRFFLTDKGKDHLRAPAVHEPAKGRQ